jgi:predicted O-methyltransferase YrrM
LQLIDFKERIRRALQFLFALAVYRDFKVLVALLKAGELGHLTSFIESDFLYRCAKNGWGEGVIVEIGSFKGRTTICLALGSKMKGREKVYAVDPLPDLSIRERFIQNLKQAKIMDQVVPVFQKSDDAVRDFSVPIRLLFIDGNHEYEAVKNDILLWKDHVIDGGIIAFHDYLPESHPAFLEGVNRAVNELVLHSEEFVVEGRIDSIIFVSKKRTENKALFTKVNKINRLREYCKARLDHTWFKY